MADVNQQCWPCTALIWSPASIRAMPAWKQEVTLSALLKYACCWQEGPYCRALKFSTVLRISLAAARGYEGTLSFSSGRAEQILSQAMEMRHVSKSCLWVPGKCLSVTLCVLPLCLAKRCVSASPREAWTFAASRVSVTSLAEPQTDFSAP